MIKRSLDILFCLLLFPVALPLSALASVGIVLTSGRPVFFIQNRPGLGGKLFPLIKFRTMEAGHPGVRENERITAFGSFLRKSSLDEIPQLWNIFKGDMSWVGPRPLLEEYLALYSSEQMRRHEVRPGLTGWAQINGRTALEWNTRFKMDVWYVDHHSLFLDLRILLTTLGQLFFPQARSEEIAPLFTAENRKKST